MFFYEFCGDSLDMDSCFNNTLSAHADVKTHKAQCMIGLQSHIFLSMFQRMIVKYRLTSHTVYTAGNWIDSVTCIQELCESLLVAEFALKRLQSVSESDGTHYTHTFSYTLFCSFIFLSFSAALTGCQETVSDQHWVLSCHTPNFLWTSSPLWLLFP